MWRRSGSSRRLWARWPGQCLSNTARPACLDRLRRLSRLPVARLDVAGAIGGGQPGLQLRQGVARSRSTDVVAAQLPDSVVGVGRQFACESGVLTKAKPPVAPARCAATGIDALFPSRLPQVRGGAFLPALPC